MERKDYAKHPRTSTYTRAIKGEYNKNLNLHM